MTVNPQWKLFFNIPETSVHNVQISKDKVGMIARRYDALLTTVIDTTVNNINIEWSKPFDITSLDPMTLPFLSNMFTNLHVSPYYVNEYLYIGFTYFVDPIPQTEESFREITDTAVNQYKYKVYRALDLLGEAYKKVQAQ